MPILVCFSVQFDFKFHILSSSLLLSSSMNLTGNISLMHETLSNISIQLHPMMSICISFSLKKTFK